MRTFMRISLVTTLAAVLSASLAQQAFACGYGTFARPDLIVQAALGSDQQAATKAFQTLLDQGEDGVERVMFQEETMPYRVYSTERRIRSIKRSLNRKESKLTAVQEAQLRVNLAQQQLELAKLAVLPQSLDALAQRLVAASKASLSAAK